MKVLSKYFENISEPFYIYDRRTDDSFKVLQNDVVQICGIVTGVEDITFKIAIGDGKYVETLPTIDVYHIKYLGERGEAIQYPPDERVSYD